MQDFQATEQGQGRFRENLLVGLFLTLLLFLAGIKFPALIERLNNLATDFQVSLLPEAQISSTPVIVEVDEKSLAAYGQWPWPRYQVARLLAAIQQCGASAVGVDALFAERDRTSPTEVLQTMSKEFKVPTSVENASKLMPDYDAILGHTLNAGPFVLSYLFTFDNLSLNPCKPKAASSLSRLEAGLSENIFQAKNVACNIQPIQEGAAASGFINAAPDDDGLYRKVPLLIEYQDRLYPSLALQTYLTASGDNHFSVAASETGLNLTINQHQLPLDNAGRLLVKYPTGRQVFLKISAADLLAGSIATKNLQGKIVFIGFSATGLHEFRPTPYAPQFLGVELHATVIDNISRQDFLQRTDHALWFELTLAALLTLGLLLGLTHAAPVTCVIIPVLLVVLISALSQYILASTGVVISPAVPVTMVLVTLLALALLKFTRAHLLAKRMTLLVAQTQEGIIESFCSMCEYRDPETGAHIKRTQNYVKVLAEHLQTHPKFKRVLTTEMIDLLFKAAPLHDIGKIGIRDNILLKPGQLGVDEMEVMKSHPQIGADIIKSAALQTGWNPFMQTAYQISLYHQEKWDGSGYPEGLTGENIPLSARFMALADVYDALISKRVYKPAFSHNTAVTIIKATKGIHFDPLLVDAFEVIHEEFRDIALRFLDDEEQRNTLLGDNT